MNIVMFQNVETLINRYISKNNRLCIDGIFILKYLMK